MKERNLFKILFLCFISLFLFCGCVFVTENFSIVCDSDGKNCKYYEYNIDKVKDSDNNNNNNNDSNNNNNNDDIGSSMNDSSEDINNKPSSIYVDKDYGTGTWIYHGFNSAELKKYSSSTMPFAEYVPENAISSGDSLPLIIFLHGYAEIRYEIDENGNEKVKCPYEYCLMNSSFLNLTSNWNTTGLKNIPAIMMAPHLQNPGWGNGLSTIKAMISYAKDKYNINENKIVLIGHSHGGYGVANIFSLDKNIFSALVIMSGSNSEPKSSDVEALKAIPLRGYTENSSVATSMKSFFNSLGRINDLTIYDGATHGQVPKKAFIEDKNEDGISDLIYWALSQTK